MKVTPSEPNRPGREVRASIRDRGLSRSGVKDVSHVVMDFVLSSEGQDILSSQGFIKAKT